MGITMGFQASISLSEQIAKHISDQIITGELVEGERIQELRIAKELDVSRGSVREALLILQRSYLIEIYPRRGAIVSEMSAQQVQSLFDTSVLVMGSLVQRTSERWRQNDHEQMNELMQQLDEQVRLGDIEKFYDQVFIFLQRCNGIVANPYLKDMFENLLPALRRSYFLTLNTSRRELQEAVILFRQVIDAILIRKGEQAALFMEDFCRHLRNLVLDSLARMKQIELAWAQRSRR
jgi:DNA-binding GntR family transcriptional regulator